MKNTFVLLLAAGLFFSCKKSSSGSGSSQPPSLSSITVYLPTVHSINIQSFTFSGTQFYQYTVETIDSTNTEIMQESSVYSFLYGSSATLPASCTFQATEQLGVNVMNGGGTQQNFLYDNKNRLIEDSTLPISGQSDYDYYAYIGDSVNFTQNAPGSGTYPAGGLNIVNGNVAVSSDVNIVYGSLPNPLYDPAIGNTFGVFFYDGLIGFGLQTYSLPVDFISRYLPTSWNDASGTPITTFTWTTGPGGKVTGGTATNFAASLVGNNTTAQITFTYY